MSAARSIARRAELKARAEIDAKAASIATATKEVEKMELEDAMKTNADKRKDANKMDRAFSAAVDMKMEELNKVDHTACNAHKAEVARAK